ncbi:hypothetical protein [Oceanirhabdus sp. W0125-5]|uniref:hypothetical protein n=1 Tax=Oceanirhabdus sp. W0125-5 TaxID=2999116 RepID=UPI0022F2D213|nr:hypothetical protein [Oceanirhabdus sp. W0125-5]WBW94716.1 hypothetical protein OW730_13525 [Oceanirhabdus sp. W0125-5]
MNKKTILKKFLLGIINSFIIIILNEIFNNDINNILNDCHRFYFPVTFGVFLSITIVVKNNIRELLKNIMLYSIPYYFTFILILLVNGVSFKITILITIGQALVAYIMSMELSMHNFANKSEKSAHRSLYFIVLVISIIFCVAKEINEGITILIVLFSLATYSTISFKIYNSYINKGGEGFEE